MHVLIISGYRDQETTGCTALCLSAVLRHRQRGEGQEETGWRGGRQKQSQGMKCSSADVSIYMHQYFDTLVAADLLVLFLLLCVILSMRTILTTRTGKYVATGVPKECLSHGVTSNSLYLFYFILPIKWCPIRNIHITKLSSLIFVSYV